MIRWEKFIKGLKGTQSDGRVVGSAKPPFCQMKPFSPKLRPLEGHAPQISFKALNKPLGLSICLGMVGGTHMQLGPCEPHELLLK